MAPKPRKAAQKFSTSTTCFIPAKDVQELAQGLASRHGGSPYLHRKELIPLLKNGTIVKVRETGEDSKHLEGYISQECLEANEGQYELISTYVPQDELVGQR